MKPLALHGRLAVRASARTALPALIKALDPDRDDIVRIVDDVLEIKLDRCDEPAGFHAIACKLLADFGERHGTAAAVFDYDGTTVVVGPSAQQRKEVHVAYLASRIQALSEELTQVLARPV